MQSATELQQSIDLIPADQLRLMTPSLDVLNERRKNDLVQGIMETMVKRADQGYNNYGVNLLAAVDKSIIDGIVNTFKDLGYEVKTELGQQQDQNKNLIDVLAIVITW